MSIPLVTGVLLADDHPIVRHGLRDLLNAEADFRVVDEVSDGAEAVRRALEDDVHLAILDVTMPRMTGLQAARELSRRRPALRILMLSMHENEQFLFEALRAGASGYVLKTAADRDLVHACRATMRGETFLYAGAVTALVRDYLDRARGEVTLRGDGDGGVLLVVRDDGVGLPPNADRDSNGPRGMRERALLVGGDMTITAARTGGTEVRLHLPSNELA